MDSNFNRLGRIAMQSAAEIYGRDCRMVRAAFAYRRLRNKIWWDWRRRFLSFFRAGPAKDGRLHIFWHLRGGVGDVAAARLAVEAMRKKLPQAVFYYHTDSPQAARAVFVPDHHNIFLPTQEPLWYKYDIAFELCQSFRLAYVNEGRVQKTAPGFLPCLEKMRKRQQSFSFFLQDSYLLEDLLGRYMLQNGLTRLDLQSYLSGLDFDTQATPALPACLTDEKILDRFGLAGKKYITFHDGIDATFSLNGQRPLKCWSLENWQKLAALIKAHYPDKLLVQLGGKNSPRCDFADVCLVGKTQLVHLPALLHHSTLHIDAESGLVQLSRYLQNPCVVLFGPTDKDYFGIQKNTNLKQTACASCMWLKGPQWHTRCALGYGACQNMQALTPQQVFEAVQERLK